MNEQRKTQPFEVLLVEDNPGDVVLIREALRDGSVPVRLSVAVDGDAALARLRRQDVPRPDLILLDLNLPRLNGREVLAAVKADPGLLCIPVVVLTSSEADSDVAASYDLHANCYIVKPSDLEQLLHVVRSVVSFWLTVVKLPRGHE
jgi:two-component system, chemotaxis family, response regulator Rcp1